jgi:hypothetical protein
MPRLKAALKRLRGSLMRRTEDAYTVRDQAATSHDETYADGEAHAYGVAADAVRDEQSATD